MDKTYILPAEYFGDVPIKWWEHFILLFMPTYIQIDEGYKIKYKTFLGKLYVIRVEKLMGGKNG